MQPTKEGTEVHQDWAGDIDHPIPPEVEALKAGGLPGHLAGLKLRLGIQRWPEGTELHFQAKLGDTLREVMKDGAGALGEDLLPPHAEIPLDYLRNRNKDHWSAPIENLESRSGLSWRTEDQGASGSSTASPFESTLGGE